MDEMIRKDMKKLDLNIVSLWQDEVKVILSAILWEQVDDKEGKDGEHSYILIIGNNPKSLPFYATIKRRSLKNNLMVMDE